MRKYLSLFVFAIAAICPIAVQTGCANHGVTLETGGPYSSSYLATTDQAILDASKAIDGFLSWYQTNATFLAKYPEVGQLATQVQAHKKEWEVDAYAARDAYAAAEKAYKDGLGTSPTTAKVDAALSILNSIAAEAASLNAAHAAEISNLKPPTQ
jgi:hypothetical protein